MALRPAGAAAETGEGGRGGRTRRNLFGMFFIVYIVMLVLLGISMGAALLDLGPFKPLVHLGIAGIMALMLIWFFMHAREATPLIRIFALAGFTWLLLLFGLGLNDVLTRGWYAPAQQGPESWQYESPSLLPPSQTGGAAPGGGPPQR